VAVTGDPAALIAKLENGVEPLSHSGEGQG